VPKLSINFEEILSHAHGNFEEQNRVLELSVIIINYCIIIIIRTFCKYNCVINSQYNYYSIFLTKASSRNAIRKKFWKELGVLLVTCMTYISAECTVENS
jgi:hypothetical protein